MIEIMKKILYYLNTVVMLPFFLIGVCFERIAFVCAWIMDKIDFRLNLINDEEDEDEDISAE